MAMQPAIDSNMVDANARIIEGREDDSATFTSVSTCRNIKPRMSVTATTPANPKLKKLSPKIPGLSPGCTCGSKPTVEAVTAPTAHVSRKCEANRGTKDMIAAR